MRGFVILKKSVRVAYKGFVKCVFLVVVGMVVRAVGVLCGVWGV